MKKTITIAGKEVGYGRPCYIISEIGNNHDADLKKAKELINASAETGVDAVKFQTFKAMDIVNPYVPANAYPGWDVSDKFKYWYEFVETIAMPYEWYDELIPYTKGLGMDFISTPASLEAAHFLAQKKVDALKIASMDLNNTPFLKEVDKLGMPIILSTGMSTLPEIKEAVAVFRKSPLSLLHCVSNYPLNPKDANLLNIKMLRDHFSIPTGFSNHALGYDLDLAAVTLGACIIEKHFTLDRATSFVAEHHFSMQPEEMKEMIQKIRIIEQALGSYDRRLTQAELHNRDLSRRGITVTRAMRPGDIIRREDLTVIRPATGIAPKNMDKIIGKKVVKAVESFKPLLWEDVQ